MRQLLTSLVAAASMAIPFAVHAGVPEHERTATVTAWSPDFKTIKTFEAFEPTFKNGGTIAAGNTDGDSDVELVVGAGPGRSPDVRIFSSEGIQEASFRAYPEWFKGGVRVAVADLDGDGKVEIVTTPGPGIEPQMNIFYADGTQAVPGGVWVYAKGLTTGVHVATGDLDGDGADEIVTAPGPGGGPHVRVWKPVRNGERWMLTERDQFFAYDGNMTDGVTVTVLNTKWGAGIVTGVESWSSPLVRRFDARGVLLKEFYAYATSSRSGVSVMAWDMDGDGTDEIVTTQNGGASPELRVVDLYGTEYRRASVMDAVYRGAISLSPTGTGLVSIPAAPTVTWRTDVEKSIRVDLIEQRLYAIERGRVVKSMPISSGILSQPTPEMETTVKEKIPIKRYRWVYGPNHPDNYDVPNVRWNLNIYGPFYIHHAYWHNGFGRRRSHGCINVGKEAEWLYAWAEVGIPVTIMNGLAQEKAAGLRMAGRR